LRFDESTKSVPHIGWNTANLFHPENSLYEQDSQHFYFVHSYCAKYDPQNYPEAANWTYTTTQYGKELFISSVWKGNIFGTQFHPEKSGLAGLRLLDAWLSSPKRERITYQPSLAAVPQVLKAKDGFTKRIIACMDVRINDEGDLVVTKGDQYDVRERVVAGTGETTFNMQGAVRNLGKPVFLAAQYYADGADELCLLNITSFRHSPLHDQPMIAVVRAAAACVFVPLTIGGGIKDTVDPDGTKRSALEVAGAYFRAGADKVSIGSEAVYAVERLQKTENKKGDGTSAIESIAQVYGSQAVVVSIDPRRAYVDPQTYSGPYKDELVYGKSPDEAGKAWWYQCTVSGGRESRPVSAVQLARGAETLGAGEILLNSIDRDGTGLGFDLDLLKLVKQNVRIPVVASSGAGKVEHFVEVFEETGVEAALAAGIFHRKEVGISEVKDALRRSGINARSSFLMSTSESK
jgi:glutamine amidotransferase/cyclase